MKEVQYTFQVPDSCPEQCEAFNPLRWKNMKVMTCLHEDQCKALHRVMEANAELDRILESAGGASPAPTGKTEGAG